MTTSNARIITNFGANLALLSSTGKVLAATARRKLGLLVCGDYVHYSQQGDAYVVESLEERHSVLARPDRRGALKPLCSNIDQLLIVVSHQPAYDLALIDAYILYARNNHIDAALVFNKSDLAYRQDDFLSVIKYYQHLGYQCVETSTETGMGMRALAYILDGKTSILVGQSGVGKSSLINYLLPDKDVQIGALSAANGLGSHTTTTTILYQLTTGGDLVDSPGVREFASCQFSSAEIRNGFVEFGCEYLQQNNLNGCKFHNCQHLHEPQCAVLAALQQKLIAPWRYRHYCKMLQESQAQSPY